MSDSKRTKGEWINYEAEVSGLGKCLVVAEKSNQVQIETPVICMVSPAALADDVDRANAAFICKAVNNHEELVQNIEHCKLMFENILSGYDKALAGSAREQLQEKIDYLETLIQKAK